MTRPLEVCIDTPAGLAACATGGADRIELCSALALGGLTPSQGLIELAAAQSIPVHVMIRPVPGGFCVTCDLVDQMVRDIELAKSLSLRGVVFGALTRDCELDHAVMTELLHATGKMETTLHRAFDLTPKPLDTLQTAIDLGMDRILTSGGGQTALEGAKTLAELKRRANGQITIAAGSGITAENVRDLLAATDVDEVHASCSVGHPADPKIVELGFGPDHETITDPGKIRALKTAIAKAEASA